MSLVRPSAKGSQCPVLRWRQNLPHPALAYVVLAWGLNFSVIKVAYRDFQPAALGLLRYAFMLPLLALWCVWAKQGLKYEPGTFWKLNLAGFLGNGIYMVFFLEGLRTAPPLTAAIALATSPIITVCLSVALGYDKFSPKLAAGTILAFGGVAFSVVRPDVANEGSAFGALLVVISAALWSVSILMYNKLMVGHSPIKTLTLSLPGAALALIPYGLFAVLTTRYDKVTVLGYGSLAYLIVLSGVGAFAAYYRGLKDVGPSQTSLTQYFVPPVAGLFGALVFRKPAHWQEFVGLAVVLSGVALANSSRFKVSVSPSESQEESPDPAP